MKSGTVALIGRPNAGKSTLINRIIGQKVAITSPKPQTTQFAIEAAYEDSRGQILFIDTPGIFAKTKNPKLKEINNEAEHILSEDVDAIVYLIDHTRKRGLEENRVLGALRKTKIPKLLVINKIDKRGTTYYEQYRFLEDEFEEVVRVSALKGENINHILDWIFEHLPEGEELFESAALPNKALNLNSRLFLEELIREKAFLRLRRELPYMIRVVVDEIENRKKKDIAFIKARIIAPKRYKKMIIGQNGSRIKEIGMMARRELEIATGRKIYLALTVEEEQLLTSVAILLFQFHTRCPCLIHRRYKVAFLYE